MGFTLEEDAKPKVPHPDGLQCVSCGAGVASQWRGINGDHCSKSKCKDHAKQERAAASEAASNPKVAELEERLTAAEARIKFLEAWKAAQGQRTGSGDEGRCAALEEQLAALTRKMELLTSYCGMAAERTAGGKRKPPPAGVPLPRAPLGVRNA